MRQLSLVENPHVAGWHMVSMVAYINYSIFSSSKICNRSDGVREVCVISPMIV